MIDQLLALVVDEGKWLTFSMLVAALAVVALLVRHRRSTVLLHRRIAAALNLSAGVTIASMATGHLLAVITKLALGTLREGSVLIFLAIGVGLLIPAVVVVRHTPALLHGRSDHLRTTVLVNGWLTATLLALGLHNLPLAAPALFTMAYRLYPGGAVGWAIVGVAVAFTIALFGASLVFLASGQSFEQFRGIQ